MKIAAACVAAALTTASPAFAAFSGYYRLTPRHSGKAVVVQSASTANGADVIQWTYGGSQTNDEWQLADIGGGYYRIDNRHSGKAMVVLSASTADGADVIQFAYGGTNTNDEWEVVDLGTGYFRLNARHSGRALEVTGAGTADGADVVQRTWTGGTHQQFEIVPVGSVSPTATPTPTPPGPTPTPTPTPSGTTFLVSSISELQSRINAAAAGHRIVLRNGTYSTSGSISVSGRNGTASSRIVIAAETTGGVTIGGSAGFSFSSSSYVTIEGFRFTHASTQTLAGGNHHLRFTRNVFQIAGSVQHYMSVNGDDCEIDRNTFQNKSTVGVFLTVRGPGGTAMAQRTSIHRNYFVNHSFTGSNGGEGIQVGLSGLSLTAANSIIELNLFERMNGDPEAISIKSTSNTVRYNTIRNGKGCIVLRHGNNSTVAGNFVLDSDCGIRFYGNDHRIYNNYISGVRTTPPLETGWGSAITVGSGAVEDHLASHSADLRKVQDRPDRVRVMHNTLANNFRHIGGENRAFAPRDCVIANNIIQGDNGTFVSMSSDPPVNFLWEGNILWGAAATGNIPSSGFRRENPQLTLSSGVSRLSASSPAIDTGVGSYTEVTVDMDGHARSGSKDVGADEYSTSAIVLRPLTTADVGPAAP
jgi:hypothetical protein